MKNNKMANGLVVIASVLGIAIASTACSGSRHAQIRANRTPPTPRPAGAIVQGHASVGVDPTMAKLPYDQRLEYGFQHGFWNGVVGGVVTAPGRIVTYQLPGARIPEVWRDFDFKVESYTGRGHRYATGSKITLRAAVENAVVNGVHFVQTLEGSEPVIQPGDHLLVFDAPGDMGGGNTSSRIVVPRASFVDVIRDGTVYPESSAPSGVSPDLPESVDQFLAHFSG